MENSPRFLELIEQQGYGTVFQKVVEVTKAFDAPYNWHSLGMGIRGLHEMRRWTIDLP